jgi:hypothetical protein
MQSDQDSAYSSARILGIPKDRLCLARPKSLVGQQAADIAKVPEWVGHVTIATTRVYDRHKTKPEDSPALKIRFGVPQSKGSGILDLDTVVLQLNFCTTAI